jgi:hypothetical protein
LLSGFPFPLVERLAQLGGLELKDLGLPGVGSDLVFNGSVLVLELLALELSGLDLEQLGLLAGELLLIGDLPLDGTDLLGLFEECSARIPSSDDRELACLPQRGHWSVTGKGLLTGPMAINSAPGHVCEEN